MKAKKKLWAVPSKRAESYAKERKIKVHMKGPKEGKQLTAYEAGVRSGYLQCQTDHAEMYKYKKSMRSKASKKSSKK